MMATSSCPSLTGHDDNVTHHDVPSDVTRVSRSVGVVMMMVSGQALVRAESRDQAQLRGQGARGHLCSSQAPGAQNSQQHVTERERDEEKIVMHSNISSI